ncbi:Uncharacterized protein SCG7109_AK_00260 [Chlamydiales bacterium SCGC AG-110-M15]|nr:Uncharacterized protein SCG7109_AK_00260 [Chlamydiales bacterium SCGC AG-110-M15]
MLKPLKKILVIQEFDIKMIRLMRLKKERNEELSSIHSLRSELQTQLERKEEEIMSLKKDVRVREGGIDEIKEKIKKLEGQQSKVKKVDEFNALSQEIAQAERERTAAEARLSDVFEILCAEEEGLEKIQQTVDSTAESSRVFEDELQESIRKINIEGKELLEKREDAAKGADEQVMRVYDKLLRNKKDRVLVPIENRTCSGCHIALTAQHENLVRRGERLVFCEHCSRILFWQDSEMVEETGVATKRRRRRANVTA